MKKSTARLAAAILLFAVIIMTANAEEIWDKKRFVLLYPDLGMEYWARCCEGAKAADADLGTNTRLVPISISTAEELEEQLSIAEISQADGIILPIHYPETQSSYVYQIVEAGIPVVTVDADDVASGRTAFVGTDSYTAGVAAGKALAEACNGVGKVGILKTASGEGGKIDQIEEGIRESIIGCDITIVCEEDTGGELLKAFEKTRLILTEHPEVTAVVCLTAYDVLGAAKYIDENDRGDIVLIGFDDLDETIEYIRKGVIRAVIVQDPYTMGYEGVRTINRICNGETLEENIIKTDVKTLTADNIDEYQ